MVVHIVHTGDVRYISENPVVRRASRRSTAMIDRPTAAGCAVQHAQTQHRNGGRDGHEELVAPKPGDSPQFPDLDQPQSGIDHQRAERGLGNPASTWPASSVISTTASVTRG